MSGEERYNGGNDPKGLRAHAHRVMAEGLENSQRALELRRRGFTYADVGRAMGVSKQRAHQLVQRAIRELRDETAESAETVRALELDRLDRMLVKLWNAAFPAEGEINHKVAETMLKIMDRRARYLGLDAPSRHEVVSLDHIDQTIAQLEEELARRAGG